jgi:cell division protein FtsB
MAAVRRASSETVEAAVVRPGRRASRLGLILLALSALFFGVNFGQEWLISHQIQERAAQLQARIAATRALNTQLQSQLAYYRSKEYIIPTARRVLGMARPGDTLMYVKQEPPTVRIVRVHVRTPAVEGLFIRLLRAIFQ